MSDSFYILQLFFDSGLFVLIWLVQLIIYPGFLNIGNVNFKDVHKRYTARISLIVIPLMLGQLSLEIIKLFQGEANFPRLALTVSVWLITFIFAVPAHNILGQNGRHKDSILTLIKTNWLRTIIWSVLLVNSLLHFL